MTQPDGLRQAAETSNRICNCRYRAADNSVKSEGRVAKMGIVGRQQDEDSATDSTAVAGLQGERGGSGARAGGACIYLTCRQEYP